MWFLTSKWRIEMKGAKPWHTVMSPAFPGESFLEEALEEKAANTDFTAPKGAFFYLKGEECPWKQELL